MWSLSAKNQLPKIFANHLEHLLLPLLWPCLVLFTFRTVCARNNFQKFTRCCTMVVVWIAICVSQFNFRSIKPAKQQKIYVSLHHFSSNCRRVILYCYLCEYGIWMQAGFVCCLIFIVLCYLISFIVRKRLLRTKLGLVEPQGAFFYV